MSESAEERKVRILSWTPASPWPEPSFQEIMEAIHPPPPEWARPFYKAAEHLNRDRAGETPAG